MSRTRYQGNVIGEVDWSFGTIQTGRLWVMESRDKLFRSDVDPGPHRTPLFGLIVICALRRPLYYRCVWNVRCTSLVPVQIWTVMYVSRRPSADQEDCTSALSG